MTFVFLTILLSLFGLFNLFGINQDLFWKQLINIIFAFLIFFILKKFSFNFFKINSRFFYLFFLSLLILSFIIGVEIKGSKRWIDFGFFSFQSSEFLKPFFILFLSDYLSKKNIFENDLFVLFKTFIYFFIPFFIIFKQPDLANSLTYLTIFLVLVFFSKINKKYFFYIISFFIFILPFVFFILKPYQKARVLSFLNPYFDTKGASYNIIQSIITIGSGGFLGKGLGFGTQSKLNFLPENTTDFAFASLVEQFGFFGGGIVIFIYSLLIFFIFKKILYYFFEKNEDSYDKFLFCLGICSYIVFQFFVNVGMNMGIMPVAGVALPFISYGGSAIMSLMISLALLP
ncbi:MAG: FtsW/RodA/SpoVE family cell cycle protein [Patescibacteria group bacterium]|nr:FtsW/RodA/SpoVE family cell cycle protein [Patescibacteria group bacterium]